MPSRGSWPAASCRNVAIAEQDVRDAAAGAARRVAEECLSELRRWARDVPPAPRDGAGASAGTGPYEDIHSVLADGAVLIAWQDGRPRTWPRGNVLYELTEGTPEDPPPLPTAVRLAESREFRAHDLDGAIRSVPSVGDRPCARRPSGGAAAACALPEEGRPAAGGPRRPGSDHSGRTRRAMEPTWQRRGTTAARSSARATPKEARQPPAPATSTSTSSTDDGDWRHRCTSSTQRRSDPGWSP